MWVVLLLAVIPTGCSYGFTSGTGFQGINTMAVLPFENETDRLELTAEIHSRLLQDVPRALGLRPAGEDQADIVLRGSIRSYTLTSPNYRNTGQQGDRPEVLQRQVDISVQVEIIDLDENLILWDDQGIRVSGQYLEASQTEEDGLQVALENLINDIVNGAQSNW